MAAVVMDSHRARIGLEPLKKNDLSADLSSSFETEAEQITRFAGLMNSVEDSAQVFQGVVGIRQLLSKTSE